MKSSIIPWACGLALTAMLGAGISEWCSVHQLVATFGGTLPRGYQLVPAAPPASVPSGLAAVPTPAPNMPAPKAAMAAPKPPELASGENSSDQREFFKTLVDQVRSMQQENRELRDQLGETNRDLLNLQFRQDTQSQGFRPLKISDDSPRDGVSTDENPASLLPPRAIIPRDDLPRY